MIETAIDIAKEAGAFLRENVGKIREVHEKAGLPTNLVTNVDKQSEAMIIERICARYPGHQVLAEEGGGRETSSPFKWIIDPLDGTTNYTHGFPVFSVSIAVEHEGEVIAGVVYDPNLDELFTAEKGKGAFLNGKRLRVTGVSDLARSLLATGFPYNVRENPDHCIEHFIDFLKEAQAVRRLGSAALDLAYVAAGRLDGFWEVNLNPWDMAAAALCVAEAGGRLTDFAGEQFSIYRRQVVSSNALIHEEMLRVLRRVTDREVSD